MTSPVEPIAALAAHQGHPGALKSHSAASAIDAQAFSDLLAHHKAQWPAPSLSPSPAGPPQPTVAPAHGAPAHRVGPPTAGDAILQSLQRMGGELRHSWNDMQRRTVAEASPLSMHEAFTMQWHMITMSVQYEAIGKAVGKAAQDVDQLVRMQ